MQCFSIVDIIMPKFEIGQIVWARHPRRSMQWPAKVMERAQRDCWQVVFFTKEPHRDIFNVPESACKAFEECCLNEKDSPLDLYDAYRLALREHTLRCKQTHKDSSSEATLDPQMSTPELRTFLDELLSGSKHGKQMAQSRSLIYQVRAEELGVYLREGFCQKLNFLINEYPLNSSLVADLSSIRQRMKELLTQAFLHGQI